MRSNFSASNKNNFLKLESNLKLLKTLREQFKCRKHFVGSKRKYLIWQDLQSCFNNRVRTGAIINLSIKDPLEFVERARRSFILKVRKELETSLLKVNVVFLANSVKPQSGDIESKYFQTKNQITDHTANLKEFFNIHIRDSILSKLEGYQQRDSGFSLSEILQLKVNINYYVPMGLEFLLTLKCQNLFRIPKEFLILKIMMNIVFFGVLLLL